jgi:hypothetical protein
MTCRAFGLIHQELSLAFPAKSSLSCRPCGLDTLQECAPCRSILAKAFRSYTLQIPWHITVILHVAGYSVCLRASRIFLELHLASLSYKWVSPPEITGFRLACRQKLLRFEIVFRPLWPLYVCAAGFESHGQRHSYLYLVGRGMFDHTRDL